MKKPDFLTAAAGSLFILSLGYLGAETLFNMNLLDIAGSVKSDARDIDNIQYFGRAVSAFGCYLLVVGLFLKTEFQIVARREKRLFGAMAVLAMMPLLALLFVGVPHTDGLDIFFSMLPIVGVFIVLFQRRQRFLINLAGLFLIVWSSVFTGQKILIEETLVSGTTWEDRVNARYALMLRAGFEECSMALDDLELCDASGRQDIVKSARIILGALWMLNPDGIRQDMIDNREKLIEAAARGNIGVSLKDSYRKYVDTVARKRQDFVDEMMKKYYAPYQAASKMYNDSMNPQAMRDAADTAANKIDAQVDEGWQRYERGVTGFKQSAGSMAIDAARKAAPWQKKVQEFCNNRRCPPVVNTDTVQMLSRAQEKATNEFITRTGYPPDLPSREVFEAHPQTQGMIRTAIEKHIVDKMGFTFVLPYQWRYDREGLRTLFQNLGSMQVGQKWAEKFGNLPTDLPPEDLFKAMGYPPLPALEELALDEKRFFNEMLLPEYKRKAVEMFDAIEAEKQLYANGAPEEEKGRNFVRAAYIPAISLVVSLIVVTITIIRWSAVGLSLALKRSALQVPRAGRYVILGAFVALLISLPYLAPNAYVKGTAYQRYLKGAAAAHPVMAAVLDWAIHAQPVIYRIGTPLRKLLD